MNIPSGPGEGSEARAVDYAEAMSFMAIGLAAVDADRLIGMSADEARHVLSGGMWRASTVAALAKYATITPWAWVDRPFHCWMLRRLLAEVHWEDLDEDRRVEQVARVFSMVHFGVDVSPMWFGRLRRVVVKGLATEAELRRLLRNSCVLSRASDYEDSRAGDGLPWWRRLLMMGAPKNGDLNIRQPIWPIKLLVAAFLVCLLAALGVLLAEVARSYQQGGITATAGSARIVLLLGVSARVLWWIGPVSWSRAKRLEWLLRAA